MYEWAIKLAIDELEVVGYTIELALRKLLGFFGLDISDQFEMEAVCNKWVNIHSVDYKNPSPTSLS
mgnify:CR=1 FL=1